MSLLALPQVNPTYAFPHITPLASLLASAGYTLKERLPTHKRYYDWMPPSLVELARRWREGGANKMALGACEAGGRGGVCETV